MNRYRKQLILVIAILTVISISLNITIYRAFKVNPYRLEVNYITLKDEKIPSDMNDVTIAYFTDLQFGELQNENECKKIFEKIKNLNPDLLIFGGDLIENAYPITEEEINFLVSLFNEIESPLGKFAVLGEKDLESDTRTSEVNRIYSQSQVEVLSDSYTKLTKQSSNGIQLMGLLSNTDYIMKNSSLEQYTLLIAHQPDLFNQLSNSFVNYAIAGHSHGTQVTYPVLGGYKEVEGAKTINRTKLEKLSFPYIISMGTGCSHIKARLNSTSEILYIMLKHK